MSKKLDFDFSKISGKSNLPPKLEVEKPSPKVKKRVVPKPQRKLSGIMLMIPTDKPKQWLDKDLSECTAEEFATWVFSVFPQTPDDIEPFDREAVRVDVFKKIVNFHRTLHITGSGKLKEQPKC